MTVAEQLEVLTGPDNILIVRGAETETAQEIIYKGYKGQIRHETIADEIMEAEVKKFRISPDISHKNWREKGLLPPIEPDKTPDYSFSDLQMTLYYKIII